MIIYTKIRGLANINVYFLFIKMVQSQFSLLWDSYKANICSGFAGLQHNGELVDMTLAADGHFVKVHQVLIALSSSYLKQLILSAPCQHPVIFLNNVSHATLSLILQYIYTGEVLVSSENMGEFMEAAKALHIKGLENVVEGSNKESRTDLGIDETGLCSSSKKDTKITKQIPLPVNARRILVKHNPAVIKKSYKVSNAAEEIQNYSMDMDETMNDSDDNIDDDGDLLPNRCNKPKVTSSHVQFTVSIRGSLQVILNRYIYNLHSSQSSGVRRWRCIDYRNKKCSAFVVTKSGVVINRANPHNHSFHDKKILDKIKKNAVYSALDDVQSYMEKTKDGPAKGEFVSSHEFNEGLKNFTEECKTVKSQINKNT